MQKAIAHILTGVKKKISDHDEVSQPLPHARFRFANPFIVIHHSEPRTISPNSTDRLHPHPHRGFAPVTFMLKGQGYHKDSAGHQGSVGEGDVQWMFAGKGILHSEGPTEELLKKGGEYELIQLWFNVPAENKHDAPFYQVARKEEQPEILTAPGVNFRLASGAYDGQNGPLRSFTSIISALGNVDKGREVTFPVTAGYWTLLYVAHGSILVNGSQQAAGGQLVIFEKDNDQFTVTATEDSQLLFLSAEPIDEPVSAKGNFVMNTAEEIEQAFSDYDNGLFGRLDS